MKKYLFQLAISCIVLLWVVHSLRDTDWNAATDALSGISLSRLSACFLCVILVYISRAFRLRHWVESLESERLSRTEWADIYLKSIAFGSITPARLGDFSRIALLEKTGLGLMLRSKITLLDKLSDVVYIPLGICLTAGIVGEKLQISGIWLFAGGMAALIIYLAGAYGFGRFLGFRALCVGGTATMLGFCFFIASNCLLFQAAGIQLGVWEITAIILSVGVLVSLPVSIGGIGIREGSLISLLKLWDANPANIPSVLALEFVANIILPIVLYLIWKALKALMLKDQSPA